MLNKNIDLELEHKNNAVDHWNQRSIDNANILLEKMSAIERIEWSFKNLPGEFALSSSFGIQSAVSLHMLTSIKSNIPIIVIDSHYLFPETYQFIEKLTKKLNLNLNVYRPKLSNAWQEARYGQLWNKGIHQLNQYNLMNKVEPMEYGLQKLKVQTWFSGIMRSQASSRSKFPVLQLNKGRLKVHPIIDWSKKQVHQYLTLHQLPYHPLWEKGYVSVGDIHSSKPLQDGMSDEETRFGGVLRECGLHQDQLSGL